MNWTGVNQKYKITTEMCGYIDIIIIPLNPFFWILQLDLDQNRCPFAHWEASLITVMKLGYMRIAIITENHHHYWSSFSQFLYDFIISIYYMYFVHAHISGNVKDYKKLC